MPRERIQSKKELSDFVARRYTIYRQAFDNSLDHVSKFYMQDILKDLLLIQNFANAKEDNENSEGRTEGLADVS